LALVPLAATGTPLFQALMFNDLDRLVRYFDFLAARQDRPRQHRSGFRHNPGNNPLPCWMILSGWSLNLSVFPVRPFCPPVLRFDFDRWRGGFLRPSLEGGLSLFLTVLVEALFQAR
jgi:hypothetical protein